MTAKPASFVFQRKTFVQFFDTCLVLPLCALAALPVLETLDWGQVGQPWSGITPLQWSLAILATAASFATLGQYDVIVHGILNTRVSARAAQASGAAAVALSQTLGFGLIVGTLARWRGFASLGSCCGKQGDSPRINQLFGSMAHLIRAIWFAFTAWLASAILCLLSQPVLGHLFHVLYSTETSYTYRRLPHSIAKPSRDPRLDVLCSH